MPLINLDRVQAFGTVTQIAELYDTQLRPFPQEAQDAFLQIKERDSDLKEYRPAVDQITKLFGKETAKRLILRHMYGV